MGFRDAVTDLVFPSWTSQTPYSSPNVRERLRKASRARPSRRMFSRRAWRMKALSLREGSASLGIVKRIDGNFGWKWDVWLRREGTEMIDR